MARFLQLKLWKNISTSAMCVTKKTHPPKFKKSTPNPGVNQRLRAISQSEKGLPMNFEDDIDDLELDVTNADKAFDDHERELIMQKHVQAMKIVERKYFKKAKEPNMVLWEEKEQMRYLHNSNPEEWDIIRLSESFPASQTAVKKILKANWNPQDRERILKYNESVKRNWKLLEDGKLDIDEKLKIHLMKFVSRKKAQLQSSDLHSTLNPTIPLPKEVSSGVGNIERIGRLNTAKERKDRHQDQQHPTTSPTKQLFSGVDKINKTGRLNEKEQREGHHQLQQHEAKKSELPGTYKLGDSHYDCDDGEFLFRVPGMKS